VETDVSEERAVSIIRVKQISEVGTALAVSSNGVTFPENGIPHSHRSEILKSCIALTGWDL
jgi:hypothetical protein